jgi:biopolymer transport protein ExbD
MTFKPLEHASPEMNITSLVDLALLLLIFFMLTSSYVVQPGIKVSLPQAQSKDIDPREDVQLIITKDLIYFLNNDRINVNELHDRLKQLIAKQNKRVLIIKADELVPHGKVVEVMDIAKIAGMERLGIGTRQRTAK